jgi:UDP-sugar transporter A1/2/3
VAGIPAALYVVQNYCALMAYQNLPPITFNVLNQTKTLSAALCCFLILGRVQSPLQIVSLFLLLLSALVIEKVVPLQRYSQNDITTAVATKGDTTPTTETVTKTVDRRAEIVNGVIPVLLASFLSGLAGALSQKSLQTMGRDSYLFTMELSAASLLFMTFSLVLSSPDGKRIRRDGFFHGWTIQTWIPVITNALGGIIVGLVTKYAGSVRKGFALIFGLLLSGILQSKGGEGVEKEQVVGGILAAISLWMYSSFPVAATI